MKDIENAKREAKKLKVARSEKNARKLAGMVEPGLADVRFERQLRKIATKGVVMLFNKVQEHQMKSRTRNVDPETSKTSTDAKQVSKESFLDMLNNKSKDSDQTKKEPTSSRKSWGALSDNYDFEQAGEEELENENEDEGFELEIEDDSD